MCELKRSGYARLIFSVQRNIGQLWSDAERVVEG